MTTYSRTPLGRQLLPAGLTRQQEILTVSFILIGLQFLARSWAVLGGWFYSDDFIFLNDALDSRLNLDFLLTPHDSHLMPLGNLISWTVAHSGGYNWLFAASFVLAMQLTASACCLLMLRTLFTDRWAIVVPLAFYLFSTMDLDAFMWWSAALNVLPLHIAFFLTVTFAVRHLRAPQWWSAAATAAAYALGLLADPRGLQVSVVLGVVTVLFFTAGPLWRRPLHAVRAGWRMFAPMVVLSITYVIAYAVLTPSPVTSGGSLDLWGLARTMLGTSWLTSLVGGPWRWTTENPPMGAVDPPVALHATAAVVVIALVVWAARRSPRTTGAACVVLLSQLLVSYAGLAFGRATQLGASAGQLMRFLADSLPATTLALALAVLPAAGATLLPREREPGQTSQGLRRWALRAGCATIALGCVVSTVQFAKAWHGPFPARAFVQNAENSLQRDPAVIADVPVPELVQSGLSFPNNLPSHLLRPLGDSLRTSTSGNDLRILDDDGVHQQAAVRVAARSDAGPVQGCGYRVDDTNTYIRVSEADVPLFWWASVSYLASSDGELTVSFDGRDKQTIEVQSGIHTYYLQGEESFATMTIASRTPDMTVCVDKLDVGEIVPVG